MIQPHEIKLDLPIELSDGQMSTTTMVWKMLVASRNGNLQQIQELEQHCQGLLYAQYNYTPPIHFAVREGHTAVVNYLLERGAYDPTYKIYPFHDTLITIARDRGYEEIAILLEKYSANPPPLHFKGDNGRIIYKRSNLQQQFETAVDQEDINKTKALLDADPSLIQDQTYFWGEGIMAMPAKAGNKQLLELLLNYGAKFPSILKWGQFYYFEKLEMVEFLLQKGINPEIKSWHHVTLLHDMAQKGNIAKAGIFLDYSARLDVIDEEYQSTPLGLASRWGHEDMVDFLLEKGADPNKSGASWSTPLSWARNKNHEAIESILLKAGAQ